MIDSSSFISLEFMVKNYYKNMKQSRTKKFIKNSSLSIIVQALILLLSFLNRRIFTLYMDIECLGYDGLFTNIFDLLNATEMGIGGVITFHLFKEVANDNKNQISKLMKLYCYLYRCIALIVLLMGVVIYFLLPTIVQSGNYDWTNIRIVYIIQLTGTVAGYFFSYMRSIFFADQQEYKTAVADLCSKVITQIFQIVTIVLFQNFILYSIARTTSTIIANLIVTWLALKQYPYLRGKKITIEKHDIERWNITKDIKNYFVHKVVYSVFNGTDNVVISALCGIKEVGLYNNYVIIQRSVDSIFLYRLLNPLQATIGNYINSVNDKEKQKKTFIMLDAFCKILASYVAACYMFLFQPFITIWLGGQFTLPFSFVFLFSLTSYLSISTEILYKYRSTFGDFNKDRNYMILSACVNITCSIIFARFLGVIGVQLGTIIALLPIYWARVKLVVKEMFHISSIDYIKNHIFYLIIELLECGIMQIIISVLFDGICNIIFRFVLILIVPTLLNYLAFKKDWGYNLLKQYVFELLTRLDSHNLKL